MGVLWGAEGWRETPAGTGTVPTLKLKEWRGGETDGHGEGEPTLNHLRLTLMLTPSRVLFVFVDTHSQSSH